MANPTVETEGEGEPAVRPCFGRALPAQIQKQAGTCISLWAGQRIVLCIGIDDTNRLISNPIPTIQV
jgi:hypothetical protein